MDDLQDIFQRIWENLLARPSGPLALRFLLQPTVAAILAIRDGIKDGRAHRAPVIWTILTNPAERWPRLKEGLKAVGKVMILAVVLDAIYQISKFGTFYPGEAIIVAIVLGFLPYFILRGLVDRIVRWLEGRVV